MSSSRDSRAMAAFCAEERCCQRIDITGIALMYRLFISPVYDLVHCFTGELSKESGGNSRMHTF